MVDRTQEYFTCGKCKKAKSRSKFPDWQLNKKSDTPMICSECWSDAGRENGSKSWSKTKYTPHPSHHPLNENGFVYFAQSIDGTGPIKIGFTKFPDQRIRGLQGQSPVILRFLATIEGTRRQEQELHDRFRKCCHHNEWFNPTQELMEYIDSIDT